MKSLSCAGNYNLKGKLIINAKCLCCDVKNFKHKEQTKEDRKEIFGFSLKEYIKEQETDKQL
jgi:hypothetical protein